MKKGFCFLVLLIVGLTLFGGFYLGSKIFLPLAADSTNDFQLIKIKSGLSVRAIADSLEKYEIVRNADDFILTTKLFRNTAHLKAGVYRLNKGLSPYRAMNLLVAGKACSVNIVIPEGSTSYEIASLLDKKLEIDSTQFIKLLYDPDFISSLDLNVRSLEGYLFPNTYSFYLNVNEPEIIRVLLNEFHRHFNDSLKQEVMEMGWSVHQILTLASIIEGEAMVDSERPLISAVYHNRLQKGILLQADPTIQYIIPDGPRRLLKRDLEIDSPYNTYRYRGLPPGPVNNPGLQSILAAIHPEPVDYLYFVAKGDGTHIFSRTWNEHLRAKANFDDYRRTINRQKRIKNTSRN